MTMLARYVCDKSVALVGSAKSLHSQDKAQQIDAHDVVIRMNLSTPTVQLPSLVGRKTDIWAMAKSFSGHRTPPGTSHILFMKLTELGNRDWVCALNERRSVDLTRWPQALEDQVKEFVGADPGTGIRLLYWLKRIAKPKSVSIFGMDCWETPSCWSGAPAAAHDPALERIAMATLLT